MICHFDYGLYFTKYEFSEIKVSFLNQHYDAEPYLVQPDGPEVQRLRQKAQQHGYYLSPNLYLQMPGGRFDASLFLSPDGSMGPVSSMVHIFSAPCFYETRYYTPLPDGFHVYETPFGRVGVVICFDRHIPESVRTCVAMGANLVIIPTANLYSEPLDLFEAEIRTEAMQNQVFIAMCNRVGREGDVEFAGQSLVVDPAGSVVYKADDAEHLIKVELDLSKAAEWQQKRPFTALRRPE